MKLINNYRAILPIQSSVRHVFSPQRHAITPMTVLTQFCRNKGTDQIKRNDGQQQKELPLQAERGRSFVESFGLEVVGLPENLKRFDGDFRQRKKEVHRRFHRLKKEWEYEDLPPIKTDYYKEDPTVAARTKQEIRRYHQRWNVLMRGREAAKPVLDFDEAHLPEQMVNMFARLGWPHPTHIQSVTWPVALSNRDIVGLSETGSGKTLAYIAPLLVHVRNQLPQQPGEGPLALILVRTRHLAHQVTSVLSQFNFDSSVSVCSVHGGVSREGQIIQLDNGATICVATPSRFREFLDNKITNLRRCSCLVLDDADILLDAGGQSDIRTIMTNARPDRQTMMFSATWRPEMESFARDYLRKDYIYVHTGRRELHANPNITQSVEVCTNEDRLERFLRLLWHKLDEKQKVLVYTKKKSGADRLASVINKFKSGICESYHGGRSEAQRRAILADYASGIIAVLITTDMSARGLDIPDIDCIVNFDFPSDIKLYIHRIGRTARGMRRGTAHSFLLRREAYKAPELMAVLKETEQHVSPALMELVQLAENPDLAEEGSDSDDE